MKKALLLIAFFFLSTSSAHAAARFWIGGTGNWNAASTTNWSATSGGVGGASVPTSVDDVTFDSASNATAYTVTVTAAANAANLTVAAPASGKVTLAGSSALNVFGNFNLSGGTTGVTFTESQLSLTATTTGKTVTTNSVSLQNLTFNGAGGAWTLQDDVTVNAGIFVKQGTLTTNNKNLTMTSTGSASFNLGDPTNSSTVNLGSSVIEVDGNFFGTTVSITSAHLTLNAGTSIVKVKMTDAAARTLSLDGVTLNNLWINGTGTGAITIAGSNTFNDFKDDVTGTHTLKFTDGTTQTVNTFTVSGTAGHLITITGSGTGIHNLVKNGAGTVSSDYLNIQHSVATPANTWYAGAHSTNNQGVATAGSGWIFTVPPSTFNFWQWFPF